MAVDAEAVKSLREKTGVSFMECRKALEEAGGDLEKALAVLGVRAAAAAAKKANRALGAGTVAAYVHSTGQVGALVLLNCETDFVSKNEDFKTLARDIAMHISAMRPENKEALLAQEFIKDPSKTVAELIASGTQKFGERIDLGGFSVLGV